MTEALVSLSNSNSSSSNMEAKTEGSLGDRNSVALVLTDGNMVAC